LRHGLVPCLLLAGCLALARAAHPEPSGPAPGVRTDLLQRFEAAGVPAQALRRALHAFACGQARGEFERPILTLVDYTRPSSERRLWVLDLAKGSVRFHERVAHGRESGLRRAHRFSNQPGSRQSSLGLFRTGGTYVGRHGYSLRLSGLEPGTNDLAAERHIVVHAAEYASEAFATAHGRLGRSWGCPALDPAVSHELIDTIREGTALFAHYPDPDWLEASPFLHCETLARTAASHQGDAPRPEPRPASPARPHPLAAAISLGCRIRASVSPISSVDTCGRGDPASRAASRAMSASEITPSS